MKKFEVGKTYSTRSICNSDCTFSYTVISRTKCTVKLRDKFGDVITRRIIKSLTEDKGVETIMPEGNYSMAPVIDANDEEKPAEPEPVMVMLGQKVTGFWGAGIPIDTGKIVGFETRKGEVFALIYWEDDKKFSHEKVSEIHPKGWRSPNGSPIGIFVD